MFAMTSLFEMANVSGSYIRLMLPWWTVVACNLHTPATLQKSAIYMGEQFTILTRVMTMHSIRLHKVSKVVSVVRQVAPSFWDRMPLVPRASKVPIVSNLFVHKVLIEWTHIVAYGSLFSVSGSVEKLTFWMELNYNIKSTFCNKWYLCKRSIHNWSLQPFIRDYVTVCVTV